MSLRRPGLPPALVAATGIAGACGGAPLCTVADPAGTPLNIRLSPNGPVVGTARNGTGLVFVAHRERDGKLWARVERFRDRALAADFDGTWVFGADPDCDATTTGLPAEPHATAVDPIACKVADPTGTPRNTRHAPGGEVFATLRSGTTVRTVAQTRHADPARRQAAGPCREMDRRQCRRLGLRRLHGLRRGGEPLGFLRHDAKPFFRREAKRL